MKKSYFVYEMTTDDRLIRTKNIRNFEKILQETSVQVITHHIVTNLKNRRHKNSSKMLVPVGLQIGECATFSFGAITDVPFVSFYK